VRRGALDIAEHISPGRRARGDGPQEIVAAGDGVVGGHGMRSTRPEVLHKVIDQGDLSGEPFGADARHRLQRSPSDRCRVTSEQFVGVDRIERATLNQVGTDRRDASVKLPGDEVLVRARRKIGHAQNVPGTTRLVPMTTVSAGCRTQRRRKVGWSPVLWPCVGPVPEIALTGNPSAAQTHRSVDCPGWPP
jgi:hypothetical protein